MKKNKFILFFICSLLSVSCLFGCSSYVLQKDDFYAGETVTPEQIDLIDDALANNNSQQLEIKPTTLCYWTSSGSKFHLFDNCQALSRTDPDKIITGIYDYIKDEKTCCIYCLNNVLDDD